MLTNFILILIASVSATIHKRLTPDCTLVNSAWIAMGGSAATFASGCCGVEDVSCNAAGSVTTIIWYSRGLTGSISADLAALTSLQYLYLSSSYS